MLIEKTLAQGDVACIRLSTGEEILGKVVEASIGSVILTRPIMLSVHYDQKTNTPVGVQFLPWSHGTDETGNFTFRREHLLANPMKARKDMADEYGRSTSPLDLPQKQGLIL